jgi:Ca2+-binding RTX toxin-like protein
VATINVPGQLKKAVNLEPFGNVDPLFVPTQADDIIYGGLGNDWLHGGWGDDAMSGAEALPTFYGNPTNPGNVLAYNSATHKFALYDANHPMTQIAGFLLNFDHTEGGGSDGDDRIFGDLGCDWMVGGTGRDDMYGGWGDDLMNADDNQTTNGGLNDAPDTDASYADRAFGDAGIDVLIGNTVGDRLIDWVGEFNTYAVPFSMFGAGAGAVSRQLLPGLPEFLYALSKSDGADQTLGNAPARNGEPDGELGLLLQQDSAWHDQTGGPRDPQAGNTPGGKKNTLQSSSSFGALQVAATEGAAEIRIDPTTLASDAAALPRLAAVTTNDPNLIRMISLECRPVSQWKLWPVRQGLIRSCPRHRYSRGKHRSLASRSTWPRPARVTIPVPLTAGAAIRSWTVCPRARRSPPTI